MKVAPAPGDRDVLPRLKATRTSHSSYYVQEEAGRQNQMDEAEVGRLLEGDWESHCDGRGAGWTRQEEEETWAGEMG